MSRSCSIARKIAGQHTHELSRGMMLQFRMACKNGNTYMPIKKPKKEWKHIDTSAWNWNVFFFLQFNFVMCAGVVVCISDNCLFCIFGFLNTIRIVVHILVWVCIFFSSLSKIDPTRTLHLHALVIIIFRMLFGLYVFHVSLSLSPSTLFRSFIQSVTDVQFIV